MIQLTKTLFFTANASFLRESSEDFIQYCRDIAKIEAGVLCMAGPCLGLSYGELIQLALTSLPVMDAKLRACTFCIVAHDGYDFDPPYAHVAAYLKDVLALTMPCLVIGAETSAMHVTASHLLAQFLKAGEKGCVLYLNQACQPFRSKNCPSPSFGNNSVHFFFFEGV